MKTVFKISVLAIAYFFATSMFIQCNKTTTAHSIADENVSEIITNQPQEKIATRNPIVFITGFDKGSDTYYNDARIYFKEKKYQVVEDKYSLEEIINWLNDNENNSIYGDIHIVNKSNPFNGLSLETLVKGEKVTTETLRKNITKGTLPILNDNVNQNTKIIFHADGLGNNVELMKTFKDAFCADEMPNVIATSYHSVFQGNFSKHYLAKPHYVFYPTANSPGKVDLSKEIAKKYASENNIDWLDALENFDERYVGDAYTTQYQIPVKFELDYHNSDDELPTFEIQEDIMDWIEQNEYLYAEIKQLNIPVDKFRWTYTIKNSTLIIKGKTTVVCVLKPLIKPYGDLKHVKPDTKNKRLYAMK